MLLQHLRKPVLAATLALLAIPGAALAADEIELHGPYAGYAAVERVPYIPQAECFYLEHNIPGYNCAEPMGRPAGQPDLSEKPDGIDYKFWEDNVWELQGDVVAEQPAEDGSANRPGDRGLGFF